MGKMEGTGLLERMSDLTLLFPVQIPGEQEAESVERLVPGGKRVTASHFCCCTNTHIVP